METTVSPIVYYDGHCGFCNRAVRFLIRIDRLQRFHFAHLQGELGKALMEKHPELKEIDSAILTELDSRGQERISTKSDLLRGVARYVSFGWRLLLFIPCTLPSKTGDKLYDAIAKRRRMLFGEYEICPIPTADIRSRFLD